MISVVIPYYEISDNKKKLLRECVGSLKGADEVIVIWNEGIGFGKACNKGMELARGDFICVVNDDVVVLEGTLKGLVDKTAVTSPVINGVAQNFWGAFFCLPRWVYESVGGFDERFTKGYFEDDDLIRRLDKAGVPMKSVGSVKVKHLGGTTMEQLPNRDEIFERNKKLFKEKWGV